RLTVTTVQREQLTLEDVTLVPSADYVAAYQARNKRLRIGGYVAAGLAIVALGAGIALDRGFAESTYQNDFKPRQAVLQAIASGTASAQAFATSPVQSDCYANQMQCRAQ